MSRIRPLRFWLAQPCSLLQGLASSSPFAHPGGYDDPTSQHAEKTTWPNTRKYSTTSAHSSASPPALPGRPSSSYPKYAPGSPLSVGNPAHGSIISVSARCFKWIPRENTRSKNR